MTAPARQTVRVRVPASSANLGPGFDCAGLCLALYHDLTVREYPGDGFRLRASGEGADQLPGDETNPVCAAMVRAFQACGYRAGRLEVESRSEIPVARGLGSSAAAVLAGLAAGFLLAGGAIDRDELLQMAMGSEGHADNAAPCLFGGFTLVTRSAGRATCLRLDTPAGLGAVVAIPQFSLATRQSRGVLPAAVPLEDAVDNQARVGLLVAAMALGRPELLMEAMVDRLHQPYRAPLVPGFEGVCRAAAAAGAFGAALSGSGPTIIALVRPGESAVGSAMVEAWRGQGITARAVALGVDPWGLQAEKTGEGGHP